MSTHHKSAGVPPASVGAASFAKAGGTPNTVKLGRMTIHVKEQQ